MMARGVVIALLAMLGGCTTAKEVYLPNGTKGHDIRCEGIANKMENCYQKAGEICGSRGYDLAAPQGSYLGINSLFIRCKEVFAAPTEAPATFQNVEPARPQ